MPAPATCSIYDDEYDHTGTLAGAGDVTVEVVAYRGPRKASNLDDPGDGTVSLKAAHTATTNASGQWTIPIVRGADVTLKITRPAETRWYEFIVPDETTKRFQDLSKDDITPGLKPAARDTW